MRGLWWVVLLGLGTACTPPRLELEDEGTSADTADHGGTPSSTTGEPADDTQSTSSTGEPADDTQSPSSTTGGVEPSCGNGIVEVGEECDDIELAGQTCESLGFEVGTLSCNGGCSYDVSDCHLLPQAPVLALGFSQVKRFDFSWAAVAEAEHYRLLESASPGEPWVQLGEDIVGESVSVERPLHFRWEASYVLQACNGAGCTDSAVVDVVGSLAEAVGYVKASNTGAGDFFGYSVALSGDGNTLAVSAVSEDSNAPGIDGNQADNSAPSSGAVYVFARDGIGTWSQQAYIKTSNPGEYHFFGFSVALSGDGNTLAVGDYRDDSSATGIDGDPADDSAPSSGAVYVFARDGMGAWSQQAYVKASNTDPDDEFGFSVALSDDGNTLAVGALLERSNATGINGNQANNSLNYAGAVYVFVRDGMGAWSQQAYIKASNTGPGDCLGWRTALSGDGNTLAVSAIFERSNATGIDGNQADNSLPHAGAVYVFVRDGMGAWSQQAYVKASNTASDYLFGDGVALSGDGNTLAVGGPGESSVAVGSGAVYVFARDGMGMWSQQAYVKTSNPGSPDAFGCSVALSGDGNILAVGARHEASNANGIGADQADDSAVGSGAVYVFARDGMGMWFQQAYVKASNTGADHFGWSVALSGDGNTLAVGAIEEDSNATGIAGNQADNSTLDSGAVYLY